MHTMYVQLLGNLKIECDNKPIEALSQPRLQSLFAYLVLHRDAPVPRRELATIFWLNSSESQARANLRRLLFDIRHAAHEIQNFIQISPQTIEWKKGAILKLDVENFIEKVNRASSIEEMRSAAALYSDDLLIDCYDDWIAPKREQLRLIFLDFLERLISNLENQHEYLEAINYAELMLRYDPLDEDSYLTLMRLHAARGNRAGIVQTYHACATAFRRELNIEPGPATRDAFEHFLNFNPEQTQLSTAQPRLIGRQGEWNQLKAAWNLAKMGQPQWVFLSGKEGIGKTRLAEELVEWARSMGIKTLTSRCYAAEMNLSYAPIKAFLRSHPLPHLDRLWLTELARLLPDLLVKVPGLPEPGLLAENWQRHRFFEALTRAILAEQPAVLFLDDMQWCDKDTLEWIQSLFHFKPQAQYILVSTLCLDKMCPEYPLATLWAALQHNAQVVHIEIQPLNESDTAVLLVNTLGYKFDVSLAAQIFQKTGGVPLQIIKFAWKGLAKTAAKHGRRRSFTSTPLKFNLPGIHLLHKS